VRERGVERLAQPEKDPAVGLCIGSYDGPKGGGAVSYERGTAVGNSCRTNGKATGPVARSSLVPSLL